MIYFIMIYSQFLDAPIYQASRSNKINSSLRGANLPGIHGPRGDEKGTGHDAMVWYISHEPTIRGYIYHVIAYDSGPWRDSIGSTI